MLMSWNLLGDLSHYIINGNIHGLPTWMIMAILFIIGLIIGYLIMQFLKLAIVAVIVALVLAYFGFWDLSLSQLQKWGSMYGSIAIHEAILLIAIMPLGIGFVLGLVIGLVAR